MWNDFINAKSILPGEVGIIGPTNNTKKSRSIQVIAYSSNFKEYIVFPSIKEACQLFNRLGKDSDPKLLRKYYIDTGKWYKENPNWKMTTEIPEKWFQEKGFKLVDNENATGQDFDYMTIHESKLAYILWKAVQEQQKIIEDLQKEIKELKKN